MDDTFYKELDALYDNAGAQEVERFLLEKAEQSAKQGRPASDDYIAVMNELGSFYRGRGRLDEAVGAFVSAKDAWDANREKGLAYAIILNNLAGAHRMNRENGQALSLYLESLAIYDSLPSYDMYSYASLLNNIALVYEQTGDFETAISYTRQAIAAMQSADPLAVAISNTNLASLLVKTGAFEDAQAAVDVALGIFSKDEYVNDAHVSAALNMAAYLDVHRQKYVDAIEKYREAVRIVKECCGENHDYITLCMNLATTYLKIEDADNAKKHYTTALNAARTLFGEHSAHYRRIVDERPSFEGETR